jgi:hypothetical protein
MRRILKIAVLCIALGVVTNLLVAWCCVFVGHETFSRTMAVQDAQAVAIGWLWPMPDDWPDPNMANRFRGIGWEQLNVHCQEPVPQSMMTPNMHPYWSPHSTTRQRSGLPFMAFESRSTTPQSPDEVQHLHSSFWYRWAWLYDNGLTIPSAPGSNELFTLPLRPVWPAFLAGTAFWAIVWYAPFAATRFLRTLCRRAHGLCVTCRYPVRNLDTCPECGTLTRRNRL